MAANEPTAGVPAVTQKIASFGLGLRLADLSDAARTKAKLVILDTIGVALAAGADPIGRIVAGHVAEAGGRGPSHVLGFGTKAPPALAALANGALANALDFDEGYHVSTHVLPAALAIAEAGGASGGDFLAAFAAGYEIASRLTELIDSGRKSGRGPTQRGFWHVGLVGPVAAATVAARLLHLDVAQTRMAIGIATCSSGGFRRNMGTMAKALHSGHAARAGIEAALLARRGFTADAEIIEAPLGFARAISAPDEPKWSAIGEDLGRRFVLDDPAPIKIYPACAPIHPALDAILALRHETGAAPEEVEAIEADFHRFSLFRLVPENVDGLGFSAPFLLSAAFVCGRLGLSEIGESLLHDARIVALMQRVREVGAEPERVTIRFKDGRVASRQVEKLRRLSQWDTVAEKFRICAAQSLSAAAVEALIASITTLEDQAEVARIVQLAIADGAAHAQ
jgi:2-methylcitrate dehydratase PrpD